MIGAIHRTLPTDTATYQEQGLLLAQGFDVGGVFFSADPTIFSYTHPE
jgi:hypothetical protein